RQGLYFPSHFLWDLSLGLKITTAKVIFGVKNLLDKKYALTFGSDGFITTYMPQLPRTLFLKLNVDF
ncbi:MAG: TonB-dependent receptor, partial [bacterium]|nr:TonB-dependent receptor [bacterium]